MGVTFLHFLPFLSFSLLCSCTYSHLLFLCLGVLPRIQVWVRLKESVAVLFCQCSKLTESKPKPASEERKGPFTNTARVAKVVFLLGTARSRSS